MGQEQLFVPRLVSRPTATLVESPPTPVARTQSHKLADPLLRIKTIAMSILGIIIIVIIVIIIIIIIMANQESSRVRNVSCIEMRLLALKQHLDDNSIIDDDQH